jgi:outer membrane protein assembly factor BamB
MYRVVHGSPELGMVPYEVRELIAACLAKEPSWRPDLGEVAAHCAAAAEYLGMSPVTFWPAEVARVIEAQQAAMAADVAALPVAAVAGAPARHGMSAPGAEAAAGMRSPRTWPPDFEPGGSADTHRSAKPALGGVSRRGLLIGAGIGGAIAAAGAGAWIIGSRSPAGTPQTAGTKSTVSGAPAETGTGGTGGTRSDGSGPASTAWTFPTGNEVLSNPGVANGVVYVGSRDNYLYAINAATGKQIWKTQQGWISAAPEVVHSMVCAATSEGEFSAIRAATGEVAWQQQTDTAAAFKPNWAVNGNTVILPSATQPLTAYDVATGSQTATFGSAGQFAGGAITAANGVLYAIQASSALIAVRIATGTTLWERLVNSAESGFFTGVVVSDGAVYITDDNGMLYSLNAANGNSNWSYPAGGTEVSTPVTADGMVYVTDDSGTLHAIAAAGGKQVWTHHAISSGEIGPAISGGTLYVSTGEALQALDAKTGDAVWSYSTPEGAFVSTPAVANGLVFAGSTNDNLYAIRA